MHIFEKLVHVGGLPQVLVIWVCAFFNFVLMSSRSNGASYSIKIGWGWSSGFKSIGGVCYLQMKRSIFILIIFWELTYKWKSKLPVEFIVDTWTLV